MTGTSTTTTTAPDEVKITVIHCWSAPRSRSTALLYSFESHKDCIAIDEPLYREWLIQRGDAVARPYRDNLIQGQAPATNDDAASAAAAVTEEENKKWQRETKSLTERIQDASIQLVSQQKTEGVVFCKHMAKHSFLYAFDKPVTQLKNNGSTFQLIHRHVLLIRDPVAVLSSWGVSSEVHGNNPTPDEVGIVPLLAIYSALQTYNPDQSAILLDSDELVNRPKETLQALCESLNIPFEEGMLKWESGPHACDGPWAKWWYTDVHSSNGWPQPSNHQPSVEDSSYPASYNGGKPRTKYRTMDPALLPALKASLPAYEFLKSLTHGYQTRGPPPATIYEDPRNANLLVWIGAPNRGRLFPREMAGVSPWDSAVQGGDACWEGIRVYRGRILSLERHLRRLFNSAKALGFDPKLTHTKAQVMDAIFQTLAANGMRDSAHMRLTLTRGEKYTSSMNPKFNVYGTTLIILPEWKPCEGATTYDNTKGIGLITACQRRNPPSCVDSKIHHNNLINNILPKIQANLAGAADALMLDVEGFVSETNATNIFMVDAEGVLMTPSADHCLPGITRETVLWLARNELNITCLERRISLAEFHAAEEVFTTGTMGELTPVTEIDGRIIGNGQRGSVTQRLQDAYRTLPERTGWATEIPPFE